LEKPTRNIPCLPSHLSSHKPANKICADEDDDTIPPNLIPLCKLGLPPLTQGASIDLFGCHADPNPTGCHPLAIQTPSHRLFYGSALDAEADILFNVVIENLDVAMGVFGPRHAPILIYFGP
jgi:hypothetical protein